MLSNNNIISTLGVEMQYSFTNSQLSPITMHTRCCYKPFNRHHAMATMFAPSCVLSPLIAKLSRRYECMTLQFNPLNRHHAMATMFAPRNVLTPLIASMPRP